MTRWFLCIAYRIRNVLRKLFRAKSLGAFALIVDEQNRVLLVRLTYAPNWHFPGGGVEHNESIHAALHREVFEEVGVTITGGEELFGVYCNVRHGWDDYPILFVVREFKQSLPHESPEIAEAKWFAYDELPDDVSAGTRGRLDEFYKNFSQSEYWS